MKLKMFVVVLAMGVNAAYGAGEGKQPKKGHAAPAQAQATDAEKAGQLADNACVTVDTQGDRKGTGSSVTESDKSSTAHGVRGSDSKH